MAEEIVTSPEESVSMEAPIVEAPVDIQEDVVDVEPTPTANAKGIENFKKLHKILAADEVYSQITPADFNQFLSKYSDITKLQKLHKIIAADEVYGQIMPSDINEAADKYGFGGLGKPSAVPSPSVVGGSATKGRGVEQPSTLQPRKSSEVEQSVMGYALPKTIDIGGGKVKAEEELRLPTEAEFATIEKMPLTKEAKLKEAVRLGTPPVERATQDIKSNKDKILSSEEELNKLEKELATYKQQSDSLLATYNNEQLSPEDRNKAGQEYNKVNEVAKPIEDRRNELYDNYQGYINNQKVLFNELDKAEKMRQKGLEKEYSSVKNLYEATASYSVKALTGLGKMSHMISSLIPNFGLMTPEQEQAGKMAFDESLGEINKFADGLITQEVPENYKKIFDGEFSAGKLAYVTSNAIASTIPTIAAGLLSGGAGSVMVGAGMGFDESKSIMKEAGLTDEQAEWAAFGVAIPIGFLEKYGADDAVRLLNGSKIRREVATELAKKFAGKTLTREAIYLETKKTFGEVIKTKVANVLKEGGKESITEMAQGELVEGVKQAVQEFTGVDKDENMSTVDYLKQQLMQRGEEGAGGFLGGTSMQGFGTAYSAIANKQEFSPSAYTKAMEFADPAKFQQFQNDLMLEVQNGVLTEEQANDAIANVQAIQETNALIPNSVQNLDLRTEAVNLIIEKNNIAKETEGKDPDLIAPENARLADIKKALNDISLGKKPGAEEQKVKTLADDIEVGDTVDLTPKSMALKADIEERRAAELEPINLAIAESERTGEVPVVDGEPVNKKTIDDINAKYDAEIDALNKPAPTAESQPQAEATTEENVGIDSFTGEAKDIINESINDINEDIEYYKEKVRKGKPTTKAGKVFRAILFKSNAEQTLEKFENDLKLLKENPIEFYKNRVKYYSKGEGDRSMIEYFQDKINILESNRITPDNIWEYAGDPLEERRKTAERSLKDYDEGGLFYNNAISTLDRIKNDPIGFLKAEIEYYSQKTPGGIWSQEELDAIVNDLNTKIELLEQEASTGQAAPQAQAAPLFEAPTIAAPQTLPEVENAISNLRKQEQAENEKTYNKYDEVITPLLEQEKELKAEEAQAPVAEEAKGEGVVEGDVESYKGMFNPKKTGISGLDDLLTDDGYNYFYKGVSGEIIMMSPDAYLKKVRDDITRSNIDLNVLDEKKASIIEGINKGDKINMPYLSLKENGQAHKQEGRNRAVVAKERGEKLIPVFIEKDISFEDKVVKGQEYINSAIKDGATTKDEVLSKLKEQGLHRDAIRFIDNNFDNKAVEQSLKATPTSEQAPQAFPAQEGSESEQEGSESEQKKDGVSAELEQIYRDLQAAVNKNIDEQTIRILKANPSKAMVDKAMEILKKKGIIEVDCN